MVAPAGEIADDALDAYFAAVRARIPGFARRHYGVLGTLRLHARALGLDLLRAPLNVLLVAPSFFLRLAAMLVRRLGMVRVAAWLASRHLFVETRLSQGVADLVLDELLDLHAPPDGNGRPTPSDPAWRARVREVIADYVAARHAVAEFGAGLVAMSIGLVVLKALTPSAISIGPLLARELAQQEAIQGFWLGTWAGSYYYSWYPVDASWPEIVGMTSLAMVAFALLATFMGLVTDPLQQALGLHQRRLRRLVATLERIARGEADARLALPDPYIARAADLADIVLMALRFGR